MFMLPAILIPIQSYKSYPCLAVTNIYFAYMILILIQNRNPILIRKRKYISHSSVTNNQQPLRLNKSLRLDMTPTASSPNPNPETEIQLYKSCLCLGMTKTQQPPCLIHLQAQEYGCHLLVLVLKSNTFPKSRNGNPKR